MAGTKLSLHNPAIVLFFWRKHQRDASQSGTHGSQLLTPPDAWESKVPEWITLVSQEGSVAIYK